MEAPTQVGDDLSAPALVLFAGRRVPVGADGLSIGRDPANDLVIESEVASREHARIEASGDGFRLVDLGSTNGTYLNGERLEGAARPLASGDTVAVGGALMRFVTGDATRVGTAAVEDVRIRSIALPETGRLTIGRAPSNDVALDDPNVSRFHAEVTAEDDGVLVRDLGSRNGTRLDGRPVVRARLDPGAEIGVGPFRLVYDGETFVARDDRGAVRLDARAVAVRVRERQIVAPTTLGVEPGELVAVIGSSGCGKTTLVKALAGVAPPSAGSVALNGEPAAARSTDVGYLPQGEIVHPQLTPREALRYAAKLRLPGDVSREEVERVVESTLDELSLLDRAHVRIDRLSSGERRRVGVAMELLGRPSILFLDEPTTGLDPDLETQIMKLLRALSNRARAVVVVTHATRSLEMCDRLAVLGPGGHVHFYGAPADALARFGVGDYDEIYERVAEASPPAPAEPTPGEPEVDSHRPRRRSPRRTQLLVLARRYARLVSRDRRNLAILLAQAPLLGAAIGALFGSDIFSRTRQGNPNDSAQVLFLLATTAIWLGSISAAREVIKERAVLARERALGVRLGPYLLSKVVVLFSLVALQTALLYGTVLALRPFHAEQSAYLAAFGVLLGTALVAVGMGLLVSAAARSQDQATSFIPLALLPQLLFAGAIVPVSKMGEAIEALSSVVFARWSFSALGAALDMNGRIAGDPTDARRSPYGDSFFVTSEGEVALILAAFLVAFLTATALLLRRQGASG